MSIEQLKDDLQGVITRCPSGPLTTAAEMSRFQKDELLPMMMSMLDVMDDMDAALGAVIEQSEPMLHEEEAKVFAAIIEGGRQIAVALKARLQPSETDLNILVDGFMLQADAGAKLIEEITYAGPAEDDDDDEAEDTETGQ